MAAWDFEDVQSITVAVDDSGCSVDVLALEAVAVGELRSIGTATVRITEVFGADAFCGRVTAGVYDACVVGEEVYIETEELA